MVSLLETKSNNVRRTVLNKHHFYKFVVSVLLRSNISPYGEAKYLSPTSVNTDDL